MNMPGARMAIRSPIISTFWTLLNIIGQPGYKGTAAEIVYVLKGKLLYLVKYVFSQI